MKKHKNLIDILNEEERLIQKWMPILGYESSLVEKLDCSEYPRYAKMMEQWEKKSFLWKNDLSGTKIKLIIPSIRKFGKEPTKVFIDSKPHYCIEHSSNYTNNLPVLLAFTHDEILEVDTLVGPHGRGTVVLMSKDGGLSWSRELF